MFWGIFAPSFSAILVAGLIIASFNYWLLRKERRHRITDSFCVNLENLTIDYFGDDNKQQRKFIVMKVYASVEALFIFVKNHYSPDDNTKIRRECVSLLELGFDNKDTKNKALSDGERMRRTLVSVAKVRHMLA